jgi:hypothetical protein
VIVEDAVGWVHTSGDLLLQRAIERKAAKLPTYQKIIQDVRLLVVADGMLNSGKIRVSAEANIDPMGFSAVYFFSYPVEALSWQP